MYSPKHVIFFPQQKPFFFSKCYAFALIWIEAEEAPPQESWKARRPQRWKRPAHWGREEKVLLFLCHNFLSGYSENITNSLVCACVSVYGSGAHREQERESPPVREAAPRRERERESESREGGGYIFFHLPPSNHRKEGPDPKLPIKSARGSRHYLSNKLLTDYMSRSLVHDWRKPYFI